MSQNQNQGQPAQQSAGQSQGAAQAEAAGKTVWKPANGKSVGGVQLGGSVAEKAKAPASPPPIFAGTIGGDQAKALAELGAGMLPGVNYLMVAVPFNATQRDDQNNVTLGTTHGSKRTRIPITLEIEGKPVTVFAISTATFYAKSDDFAKAIQKA